MKLTLRLLLMATIGLACIWGQKSTGTGSGSGTSTGTTTGGTTGTSTGGTPTGSLPTGSNPGANPVQQNTNPIPTTPVAPPPRPIIIMGTVIVDDGSPLPGSVNIQTICSSQQRTVAHTSGSGDFSFTWGDRNNGIVADASDNPRFVGFGSTSSGSGTSATGGRVVDPLVDCDIRAELSGYTSSTISLFNHEHSETFDIGAIILHRLTGDEGTLVSMLSLKAPKDAKKSFDKGTDQVKSKKLTEAAASFRKAVDSYPQYADAWLSLGRVETQLGSRDSAQADFQKAMDLDNKLVGPWQELGYIASDQSKWEDAARYLDQAVRLDPTDSPMAWYFSAMADYNLGRFAAAERSIRAEIKLDHGANPHAQYLLGLVLIANKDLAGGANALRTYIASTPNGNDAEMAKRQLTRVEGK